MSLSSLGANSLEPTGVIRGLGAQEDRLRQLEAPNVFLLRPVSFFENFYDQLELIKRQGIIADSVEPELPIPMVAARDVADVAAAALRARDRHAFTPPPAHLGLNQWALAGSGRWGRRQQS